MAHSAVVKVEPVDVFPNFLGVGDGDLKLDVKIKEENVAYPSIEVNTENDDNEDVKPDVKPFVKIKDSFIEKNMPSSATAVKVESEHMLHPADVKVEPEDMFNFLGVEDKDLKLDVKIKERSGVYPATEVKTENTDDNVDFRPDVKLFFKIKDSFLGENMSHSLVKVENEHMFYSDGSEEESVEPCVKIEDAQDTKECRICDKKLKQEVDNDFISANEKVSLKTNICSCKQENEIKEEKPDFFRNIIKRNIFDNQSTHIEAPSHSCSVCNKTFKRKSYLTEHMHKHTDPYLFSCSSCSKTFQHQHQLTIHERIHTGSRPFSCNVCSRSFAHSTSLKDHMRTHTGSQFSCKVCNKSFPRKSNLTKHERIHTGARPFSCSVCGKGFTQKSNLLKHENIHSGTHPFACDICGRTFAQKSNMMRHIQYKHNKSMPQTETNM